MINNYKIKILNLVLLVAIIMNVAMSYWFGKEEKFNIDLEKLVPKKSGLWLSRNIHMSDYLLKAVGADSQVWRHYYDNNGNKIEVWVAFFKDQTESAPHNPNTCYNGQGWATEKGKDVLRLEGGNRINVSRIHLRKGNDKSLAYYWYMTAGVNAGTEFSKNLFKFYYGMIKKRRDILFFRFSMNIEGYDTQVKENMLKSFIKSFFPLVKSEFPSSYFN